MGLIVISNVFATLPHSPKAVRVQKVYEGAKILWEFELPDTVLSYNNSAGLGIWEIKNPKKGLGVVFDLNDFPGATLEKLDFIHFSHGKFSGTTLYNIHILDIVHEQIIAVIDSQEAGDAFAHPRSEVDIPLGSLSASGKVGIFIEPLTKATVSENNYYLPVVTTDTSALVANTSYLCTDIDNPFPNLMELSQLDASSTNWVIDLWIDYQHSLKMVGSSKQSGFEKSRLPVVNQQDVIFAGILDNSQYSLDLNYAGITAGDEGFYIYRGHSADSLVKVTALNYDARFFIDAEAMEDSAYYYAVASYNSITTSKPLLVQYYHPKALGIFDARIDQNSDYIPDLLDQKVYLKGIVASPNFSGETQYLIQDKNAAIQLSSNKFNASLNFGDSVYIAGYIRQNYGMTEIDPDSLTDVIVLGSGYQADTLKVTLAELNESLEGRLIVVENIKIDNKEAWPAEGNNSPDVTISDATGSIKLFIDKDTDLDGWTPPSAEFRLVGYVDQYSTKTPADDGYELRPAGQSSFTVVTGMDRGESQLPLRFEVTQNYPNPFNPLTSFTVTNPDKNEVSIDLYDVLGKHVRTIFKGKLDAGSHKFTVKGAGINSGIYFYKVIAGEFSSTRKMILLK
jgi:hypothetical protein